MSGYKFDRYRFKNRNENANVNQKNHVEEIDFLVLNTGERNQSEKGREIGAVIANAVNFARDLGNEPANVMTPSRMVQEAVRVAKESGLKFEILDEHEIRKLKMGGILGVAQGSHEPPHLIILEKQVRNPKKTICLVGKGITFDTGGISIKPAKDMEKMKYDMMGAAAVIAAMKAISQLDLPFHVIGITPVCENLPSQKPQRPGDVVIAYNKKSVEVINTDAEGRLILMDALSFAEKFKPDAIIDLATLTGAVAATFGDKCIGLMSNDRKLVERVIEAGEKTSERCWELPLWEEYLDMIKGDIADFRNVGSGFAGTITAGKFLEQFVPNDTPWAHLDIAGVAWSDSQKPFTPKGPTGAGIRLLIQLLRDWK
ncbi:MAG: leucyl aminopeptidase [Candidatus Omnitrophica bacterium]|nr:leucyl aminopeptidase [Candidatus Omnitrophota bacterium]